jgi:hypothetical protein
MLSRKQKMLLHTMAAAAGVTEEADRRLIQRNIGGFYSAADSTAGREGFIAVMAHYEQLAGGTLPGFSPTYWTREDEQSSPTATLIWKIRKQAQYMGWTDTDVEKLLASKHMSGGAHAVLDMTPGYWLSRLYEALKNIAARRMSRAPQFANRTST